MVKGTEMKNTKVEINGKDVTEAKWYEKLLIALAIPFVIFFFLAIVFLILGIVVVVMAFLIILAFILIPIAIIAALLGGKREKH